MSLLKLIERLTTMDDLIKRGVTGNAQEFANKIGIGRSMLMENLREMKELGAEIEYCARKRSYVYLSEFKLIVGRESKRIGSRRP